MSFTEPRYTAKQGGRAIGLTGDELHYLRNARHDQLRIPATNLVEGTRGRISALDATRRTARGGSGPQ